MRRALSPACFALACWAAVIAGPARAQSQADESKEEVVERIDPYTKGESAALDRAGYISFGPFPIADGIRTSDVEETLGVSRVLWVETAHFKLGSTLRSYRLRGDNREEKKLKAELERLSERFERFRPPPGKIDAWLRLHLYAQRLEEQYADFCARFGVDDSDFAELRETAGAEPGHREYMGEGPFLGQEMKFTVVLTEKSSSMARFASRWIKRGSTDSFRDHLPGGSLFLGTSAQVWQEYGYELDATMHCVVADDLAHNLVEGFRKSWSAAPVWFTQGLAYWYSRRADERFAVYAKGVVRRPDDDSWKWEPRVRGLVQNRFVATWQEMQAWQKYEDLKPQDHMVAWSRVEWLLSQKKAGLRAFLMSVTDSVLLVPADERQKLSLEKQAKALAAGFEKTADELDEDWRRYVLKVYPTK